MKNRDLSAGTAKKRAETKQIETDNLAKLQKLEDNLNEAVKLMNNMLSCARDGIKKRDYKDVDIIREELCQHVPNGYLHSLGQFLDQYNTIKAPREKVALIKGKMLNFLDNLLVVLKAINHHKVLMKCGRKPLIVNQRSLTKIWVFCGNLPLLDIRTRIEIYKRKRQFPKAWN